MTAALVDLHMEGQAAVLWGTLAAEGWLEMAPLDLVTFPEMGLSRDSPDREIWRLAQARGLLLLTNNRNATGTDSLERTIAEETTPASLPVLTVGNLDRLAEPIYRRRCAARLLEVVLYLDDYRGTGRIFIP